MARLGGVAPHAKAARLSDDRALIAGVVGAVACVMLSVGLAGGEISGHGSAALEVTAFLLLLAWCLTHRRVDHSLVALALYLGLLDGYVKLSTGSNTVTLARDGLVIAIAVGALLRIATSRERIVLPPLAGFVIAFCGVVLVELANPDARGLTASLAGVRQHLEFVPLFFLGYAFVRTEAQVRKALLILVFCAAVGGVVSYVQSTLTPDQFAAWGPGYYQRIIGTGIFAGGGRVGFTDSGATVRPFGLGSDAGAGAAAAALALPALLALLMVDRGRIRWAMAPMAVGIGLAVATSGSRGAIITVVVSLMAFGLTAAASKNGLKAIAGVAVGTAIIYAAFVQLGPSNATAKRAQSITPSNALTTFSTERGQSVAAFGGLAVAHPFGVGVGTVGPASGFQRSSPAAVSFNSETQWNFLVVETGIAGVIVYVAFLMRLMWLTLTRIRRLGEANMRMYLAALAAPIFALTVAGFSGPTTAAPPTAPFLWLVAGVLAYRLVTAYVTPDHGPAALWADAVGGFGQTRRAARDEGGSGDPG